MTTFECDGCKKRVETDDQPVPKGWESLKAPEGSVVYCDECVKSWEAPAKPAPCLIGKFAPKEE